MGRLSRPVSWPGAWVSPRPSSGASVSMWYQHRGVPKAPLAAYAERALHLAHCKHASGKLQHAC